MILEKFKNLYQLLDAKNIESLAVLYDDEVVFIDPFHQIEGLNELKKYFSQLYENVDSINFAFYESITTDNTFFVQWKMTLKHPKLNKNKAFDVFGATYLKTDNHKIILHRDYFDAGSLFYEQLPIVGRLIQWIKKRL